MKVNIYADSCYTFGLVHDFGYMIETERIHDSSWYPSQKWAPNSRTSRGIVIVLADHDS